MEPKKNAGCAGGFAALAVLVGIFAMLGKCKPSPGSSSTGPPINMHPSLAPIPTLTAAEAKKQAAQQAAAAKKAAEEKAGKVRRLWMENHSADDGAREMVFRQALRGRGARCDEITSAIMRGPGSWEISCAPGYHYRFRFDKDGNVLSAQQYR